VAKERFNTLPGLTGLWQVSGKNKTTFEEMIQLDIRYARTKSPWLDLAIICKTIPALMVQMIEVRRDRKTLEFEGPSEDGRIGPRPATGHGPGGAPFPKSVHFDGKSQNSGENMTKPVKIAVVGCGYWGPNLIRNFRSLPESNLKMMCDVSDERLKHLRSVYPEVEATARFRARLERRGY